MGSAPDLDLELRCRPVADGGEGTAQVICDALDGYWVASAPNPSRRTRPRWAIPASNSIADDQSYERPLDLAVRLIRPAALAKVEKVQSNDLRGNVISVLKSL